MSGPFVDTPHPPPPPLIQTSGKAIWSLILGVASFVCVFVAGLPAILIGVLALGDIRRSQGKLAGRGLAITGIVIGSLTCLVGLVIVVQGYLFVRQVNLRMLAQDNLRQIGLGVHNYHDVFLALPLAGSEDPKIGLNMSWRVRLLPFLEQMSLHDLVNYNEPWDSPANSPLLAEMPRIYDVPPKRGGTETSYLAFSAKERIQTGNLSGWPIFGSGTARGDGVANFASVTDGISNTIMVVEADRDRGVPWMKPADLSIDPANPKAGLGHVRSGGFIVVMGDGSVRFLANSIDNELVLKLILRDDGISTDF